jgi:hypothetical protein
VVHQVAQQHPIPEAGKQAGPPSWRGPARVAEAELAALDAREERVRELEADRDALLAYYA